MLASDSSEDLVTAWGGLARPSVPDGITSLTRLDSLNLAIGEPYDENYEVLDMNWLSKMTNLQKLELRVWSRFKLLPEMAALTKLTEVSLTFSIHQFTAMNVDWQKLVCLQRFSLVGKCKFDHCLLRLANCPSLMEVSLGVIPADVRSSQCYAALDGFFRQHAPGVAVNFGGDQSCAIWEEACNESTGDVSDAESSDYVYDD